MRSVWVWVWVATHDVKKCLALEFGQMGSFDLTLGEDMAFMDGFT
jgi:hypothetical protein